MAATSQILEDAYAGFVMTDSWGDDLARLESVNPAAAELIGKYGIGTKLKEDGSYDWESGQLLDDVPSDLRSTIRDDEEAMSIVHDIAYGYEFYAKSLLEKA